VKYNQRTKAYELEIAKKEFLKEIQPIPDHKWEDDFNGYELDDPKHPDYLDSIVDYYDIYGREF
jgi:hypothetical protein